MNTLKDFFKFGHKNALKHENRRPPLYFLTIPNTPSKEFEDISEVQRLHWDRPKVIIIIFVIFKDENFVPTFPIKSPNTTSFLFDLKITNSKKGL
jgi:hypothetical protein